MSKQMINLCIVQMLTIVVGVISMTALTGHAIGGRAHIVAGWGDDTLMSIPTGICLILLSIAVFVESERRQKTNGFK